MYVDDFVNPRQFTYQNASPSAPIRPRPVTRKLISTSHQSKLVISRLQIIPFWLLSDGVIRTLSSLAMASKNMNFFSKQIRIINSQSCVKNFYKNAFVTIGIHMYNSKNFVKTINMPVIFLKSILNFER